MTDHPPILTPEPYTASDFEQLALVAENTIDADAFRYAARLAQRAAEDAATIAELREECAALRDNNAAVKAMFDERSVALATLREATTWQPMATAPLKAMFWVRPKTADESYHDTSGNPIVSTHAPRLHIGTLKSWSALETAVAWMPLPTPPPEEPR